MPSADSPPPSHAESCLSGLSQIWLLKRLNLSTKKVNYLSQWGIHGPVVGDGCLNFRNFKENKKKTMWRILQDFSRGYQWRRTFCSSRLPILSAFVHCCPAFARPDVQNEATPGPFAPTCSPPWSAFAEPRCFFLSGSIGSWHPGTSRCPWYLKSTAMNYSPHFSKSNLHSKNILKRFNSILLCIFITSLHHGTFLPVTNSPQECQLTVSASARSCFVSACFGNSKTPVL